MTALLELAELLLATVMASAAGALAFLLLDAAARALP
jgi:hypothetical protein